MMHVCLMIGAYMVACAQKCTNYPKDISDPQRDALAMPHAPFPQLRVVTVKGALDTNTDTNNGKHK